MQVMPKPLLTDITQLSGLSERLIRSHYENNYCGAVRQLNSISKDLSALDLQSVLTSELNGLKREELIAANSVVLHELYFESLGGTVSDIPPPMTVALTANFGSVQRWKEEFVAMGRAQSGGSGWVLLSFSPLAGGLVNQWAADPAHALAGAVPILALDMYEHAYHIDYGANAAGYIDAYMSNIHWQGVHQRYQRIVHDTAQQHVADVKDGFASRLLLDVRRAGAFEEATDMISGALWRDPARTQEWAKEISPHQKVIVYCVAGHEMSRGTALLLRALGLDAQFLLGGIEAWKSCGGVTVPKSTLSDKAVMAALKQV